MKILYKLTAMAMIASMLFGMSIIASADGTVADLIADLEYLSSPFTKADFEGKTSFIDVTDKNNLTLTQNGGNYGVEDFNDDPAHLRVGKIIPAESGNPTLTMWARGSSGVCVLSYDIRVEDFNTTRTLFYSYLSPTSTGLRASNMTLQTSSGDTTNITVDGKKFEGVEKGKWYTVAQIFDCYNRKIYYYVNDTLLHTINFQTDVTGVNRSMFIVNKSSGTQSVTYIDNVECNKYAKAPEVKSVSCSDGKIVMETTEKLDAATLKSENIKLCLGDEEIAVSKFESDESQPIYTLTPETELHTAIEYTLRISDGVRDINGLYFTKEGYVEYKFTTPIAAFDVISLGIEEGAVNARIINDTEDTVSAIMVTVVRDPNGVVLDCGYTPTGSIESGEIGEFTYTLPGKGETNCEIFFIENWKNPVTFKNYIYRLEVN